ncbi:unnamed protein product [Brugia timori]|uniref:Uncharacterized protein n=1 Tax=Brugia timori TaxID=42155 RepID=A0A0R3RDD9_9BILA|nr:unnamed protein product [Brugia timori]
MKSSFTFFPRMIMIYIIIQNSANSTVNRNYHTGIIIIYKLCY